MNETTARVRALNKIAYAPYEVLENPTAEDWQKSYDALKELCTLRPKDSLYPNTLGYLCFYGRHTGGNRRYEEAREWFEKGAKLRNIESMYKLADMLDGGLGGEQDRKAAGNIYLAIYWYCKEQFEHGETESKFADAALRLGRVFHEGKITEKDDMEALKFLLEAKYAIGWRKPYRHYGDDNVETNIRNLIDACEKPEEKTRNRKTHGVYLQAIPRLVKTASCNMTVRIDTAEDGSARLEFRRKHKEGKKPDRILMAVAPAMRCFMTSVIAVYAKGISRIHSAAPGEPVTADEYRYDKDTDTHTFLLEGKEQLSVRGGEYFLFMDDFWITLMKDNPDSGSDIPQ